MNRWEVWVCPKHGICRDDGDLLEGQDPEQANANDPDGWTGVFYCGYSHGSECCYEEVEQIWVVPESDSKPLYGHPPDDRQNPPDDGSNAGRMAETSPERDHSNERGSRATPAACEALADQLLDRILEHLSKMP